MEDILYQYQIPYDPLRPLICFDERPCFLIEDVGAILPMSPGKGNGTIMNMAKMAHAVCFSPLSRIPAGGASKFEPDEPRWIMRNLCKR